MSLTVFDSFGEQTRIVFVEIEDTPYLFQPVEFGFSEPADNDAFAGIFLTSLPVNGTLELNGVQVIRPISRERQAHQLFTILHYVTPSIATNFWAWRR